MLRWSRAVGALAALVGSLSACSLLVDTSALMRDGSGESDGGGQVDGGQVDGGQVDGGQVDAPAAPEKCIDSATRFCDDFDQPNPGSKWTKSWKQRGATSFDGQGLSLANALSAKVSGGSGDGYASLDKEFEGNPTRTRCELDLKLIDVPGGPESEVEVVSFETLLTGSDVYSTYVTRYHGEWYLVENGSVYRTEPLGVDLPMGSWFHVILDVVPGKATLTAGGATVTLSGLLSPTGTRRTFRTGVTWVPAAVSSAHVLVDNVDCTMQP